MKTQTLYMVDGRNRSLIPTICNKAGDKMIFLGGIHGSGKSYLCSKIYENTKTPFFTASELIGNFKKASLTNSKLIKNIDDNQKILVKCVDQIPHNKFILDGHLCLLNENQRICKIRKDVIQILRPSLILIKTSSPDEIQRRLKDRDGQDYNIDFIIEFQNSELDYANELASNLTIPMIEITDGSSLEQVYEMIRRS